MDRIQKLRDMLISSPDDCFLWHALGLEFLKINELPDAIKAFRQVIAADEKYVGTYYHLAKTLERLNHIQEAIAVYEKGIIVAHALKDMHAKNELAMALEDITD